MTNFQSCGIVRWHPRRAMSIRAWFSRLGATEKACFLPFKGSLGYCVLCNVSVKQRAREAELPLPGLLEICR